MHKQTGSTGQASDFRSDHAKAVGSSIATEITEPLSGDDAIMDFFIEAENSISIHGRGGDDRFTAEAAVIPPRTPGARKQLAFGHILKRHSATP